MKNLIAQNKRLSSLRGYIQKKTLQLNAKKTRTRPQEIESGSNHQEEQQTKAAKIIQRTWRKHKIREVIIDSPYFAYLSLIDPRDEKKLLSAIMFGRHEAEFREGSAERSENPFLYTRASSNAYYHRGDLHDSEGLVFDLLLREFKINKAENQDYLYLPISKLQLVSTREYLKPYGHLEIIEDEHHTISLVVIPKSEISIAHKIMNHGVIATPWEIAQNIKLENDERIRSSDSPRPLRKLALDPNLPCTKEQLLESPIWAELGATASNKKYPNKKLAVCLRKMLVNLPPLTPEAIQRIALILDIANTFYRFNYSQYAFCVYAIVHEISIGLSTITDKQFLQKSFDNFLSESKSTLCKSLGLTTSDLSNSTFIASPALSGTNAFFIATEIAKQMKVATGQEPRIKMLSPCHYFEFEEVISNSTSSDEADIFTFSTGPIVNPGGVNPGVDINRFIQRNIIDKKRTKPATLILDATTTLYKNLKLSDDAKELVRNGQLSIVLIESHQKFGLLHTDQAQHGRLFGLCSKNSFTEQFIEEMQKRAQADFDTHLDMRVGAFISSECGESLEEIKGQHFTNGAIFRNILRETSLASSRVVSHTDMLTDENELYFATSTLNSRKEQQIQGIVEPRSSFGHYTTTVSDVVDQLRICANASDDIDCLIKTAQLYLCDNFDPEQQLKMLLENGNSQEPLSIDEQIITLAMISNLLAVQKNQPHLLTKNPLKLFSALNHLLNHCTLLESRVNFVEAHSFLRNLRKQISDKEQPENNKLFFAALHRLHLSNIPINPTLLSHLKANSNICKAVTLLESISSAQIKLFIESPEKLATALGITITPNVHLSSAIDALNRRNVELKPFLLSHLKANPKLTEAVSLLADIIDKRLVYSLIDKPKKLNDFLNRTEKLETCIPLIQKLQKTGVSISVDGLLELLAHDESQAALSIILANHFPLTEEQINTAIKGRVAQIIIDKQNTLTAEKTSALCALDDLYDDYQAFLPLLDSDNFCKALLHITQATNNILCNLKTAPQKFQMAESQRPVYLKQCFDALKTFYSLKNPKPADLNHLTKHLDLAKDKYCQDVLGKDRTAFSKVLRLTFAGVVNFIAGLSIGIAHYAHYKLTQRIGFFTETNSQKKLGEAHKDLNTILTKSIKP